MSKPKDKVINEMRKIAICKPEHIDIISLLALASTLNHLQTFENPNLCHDFIPNNLPTDKFQPCIRTVTASLLL